MRLISICAMFSVFSVAAMAGEIETITGEVKHASCDVSDAELLTKAENAAVVKARAQCNPAYSLVRVSDWLELAYVNDLPYPIGVCRSKGAWAQASFKCLSE